MKKVIFSILMLAINILTFAQVPNYVPVSNLQFYYSFDSSKTNPVKDFSGMHNDAGIVHTDATYFSNDRFNVSDGALVFNHSQTDNALSSSYYGVSGNADRTAAFWIYCNDFNNDTVYNKFPYFKTQYLYGYSDFNMYLVGDMLEFHADTNERYIVDINTATLSPVHLAPNKWHLIVMKCENANYTNQIKVYVDNVAYSIVQFTTITTVKKLNSNSERITCGYDNILNDPSNDFVGKMDDIAFWDRALSDVEINHLYVTDNTHVSDISLIDASLSPNPVNDMLTIKSKVVLKKVDIYDMTGKLILSEIEDNNICTINMSNFISGTYIVRINNQYSTRIAKY